MNTHLLPCRCSAEIPVNKGQAGGSVTCPSCGVGVAVPKFRDFDRLREHSTTAPRGTVWTAAHAWLLTGLVTAALSWTAAGLVRLRTADLVNPEAIRAAVAAASDIDVYRAWKQELSRMGVRRPPTGAEEALLRSWQFFDGVARTLQGLGTLGALAAAAATAVLFSRSAAPDPEHPHTPGEASQ